MKSFILSGSRPDKIAVVKSRKNVRLETEKKERLREKPRKVTKEIEAFILSILKSSPLLTFFLAVCISMHLVFKEFSFRPFLSSHKFTKSRAS